MQEMGIPLSGVLEVLIVFSLLILCGAKELRRPGRAVLYVPTSEIPWVTLAAAALAWLNGVRLVLTNHNTRIEHADMMFGLVGRVLWAIHARADQVIAVSSSIANELHSIGVRRNVAVSSCGFSRPSYVTARRSAPTHGGIYVGRIERGKGQDDLLDVWLNVTQSLPKADLRLVGHAIGENRSRIVRRRKDLGLESGMSLFESH
jgi:glycosyltransferase involved in cell wall biosynthesis